MTSVIPLYKHLGESPLDCIKAFQKANPQYSHSKLGYAGRLDPMAEGLLLVLVNNENEQRKSYEKLEKDYEFEVLFGVSTDTYDVLGKIVEASQTSLVTRERINAVLAPFKGTFEQPYPPYSSPRVNGHPLFWWARESRLSEITIPSKEVTVNSLNLTKLRTISKNDLKKTVEDKLATVTGEFRQEEIKELWQTFFESTPQDTFSIGSFSISCSSGTYVRSIAHNLGVKLGIPSLAFSIQRTRVGSYTLTDIISRLSE